MPGSSARRRGSRTRDTGQEAGRRKDGETILYYVICPYCGAALDPGESCDCSGAVKQLPEEQTEQEAAEELERRRKYARRKARIAALRPAAPEHQQEARP